MDIVGSCSTPAGKLPDLVALAAFSALDILTLKPRIAMAIIMMAIRTGGSIIPPCSLSIDFTKYLPVL